MLLAAGTTPESLFARWDSFVTHDLEPLGRIAVATLVVLAVVAVVARLLVVVVPRWPRPPGDESAVPSEVLWGALVAGVGAATSLTFGVSADDAHGPAIVLGAVLGVIGAVLGAWWLATRMRLTIKATGQDGQDASTSAAHIAALLGELGGGQPRGLEIPRASDVSGLSAALGVSPQGKLAQVAIGVLQQVLGSSPWRAMVDTVDEDVVCVTITRNGRQVSAATIDRDALRIGSNLARYDAKKRDVDLHRFSAALVVTTLAAAYPQKFKGLCGATDWRSLGLHYVATTDFQDDPEAQRMLLGWSLDRDPGNWLAQLAYHRVVMRYSTDREVLEAYRSWLTQALVAMPDAPDTRALRLRARYTRVSVALNAAFGSGADSPQFGASVREQAMELVTELEKIEGTSPRQGPARKGDTSPARKGVKSPATGDPEGGSDEDVKSNFGGLVRDDGTLGLLVKDLRLSCAPLVRVVATRAPATAGSPLGDQELTVRDEEGCALDGIDGTHRPSSRGGAPKRSSRGRGPARPCPPVGVVPGTASERGPDGADGADSAEGAPDAVPDAVTSADGRARSPQAYYNLACALATLYETPSPEMVARAVSALRLATATPALKAWMWEDPQLAGLRTTASFRAAFGTDCRTDLLGLGLFVPFADALRRSGTTTADAVVGLSVPQLREQTGASALEATTLYELAALRRSMDPALDRWAVEVLHQLGDRAIHSRTSLCSTATATARTGLVQELVEAVLLRTKPRPEPQASPDPQEPKTTPRPDDDALTEALDRWLDSLGCRPRPPLSPSPSTPPPPPPPPPRSPAPQPQPPTDLLRAPPTGPLR